MTRVTVRARGQVTIPRDVREAAHISEGDTLELEVTDEGLVLRAVPCLPGPEDWRYWSEHAPGQGSGHFYTTLEAFIAALEEPDSPA